MFAMNNDTHGTWDSTMSLDDARKVITGPQIGTDKAHAAMVKRAAQAVLKEMDRLNGVTNTQARCIADVRKALR